MNGEYLNKILQLQAKHALYREDGKWYHNLTKFPGVLFDSNGYIIFDREEDYLSYPDLQIKKALNINNGINSLKGYRRFSNFEKLLIGKEDPAKHRNTDEESVRVLRMRNIILRKKHLGDKLKRLYNNTCQLCETQLKIGGNKFYSEVHHIIPLGQPYNGKDKLDNMICVCPNCHTLLDLKAIRLETKSLRIVRHLISDRNIEFHNSLIK